MNLNDQMARDHARDYAAKAKMDTARHALAEVLGEGIRLSEEERATLRHAHTVLQRRTDHIVAVWD